MRVRMLTKAGMMLGLVALGYALGVTGVAVPQALRAQDQPAGPSDEATQQIRTAYDSLEAAMVTLRQEGRYTPATRGVNSFAVIVGGVNALEDLETNRGVAPETFAGLYAGMATEAVAEHLSRDDQGRLTYKNKVVRMYPISRLKKLFADRAVVAGEASAAEETN